MAPSSWIDIASDSRFSLANIPFGIATFPNSEKPTVAVAIGDYALNLAVFALRDGFSQLTEIQAQIGVFDQQSLNGLAALGRSLSGTVRRYLLNIFRADTPYPHLLKDNQELRNQCLVPLTQIRMHLPFQIGDFSDFYGGMNHAYNAGALFRGQNGALLPNYVHLPMAYHGRSSSIFVSGTPVRRPWGQIVEDITAAKKHPILAPCRSMDFELELGCFVCGGNQPFDNISIKEAENNIFGFVLLNDWSARDIQRWEYVPLGPFNGKNFATTISAWVVLADALEPFRKPGMKHPGTVLPYLQEQREAFTYDLNLEVQLVSGSTKRASTICSTNASDGLVWSFPQMLAHHTITGCTMRAGDLLGSGTISGLTTSSLGCLLEQTLNGKRPIQLEGGEQRAWLEDGDEVILKAWAGNEIDGYVGFGDAAGVLLSAHKQIA
ncbi:fumarylacetoacetase [Cladophialophora bantiana CBS 173.52]|uniref:Fumarylacetoacetase n=1 Tax=Cladophialophora bantiana (strain ATCC 10958 / CBS 173.52 / CDC B-1940 / NIH 8579) TaxID=1442370 RepID=A0A0D2HTE0_CLAB1|nr:fumarylacetoacetase [Cladophialophora bantiana CBS 173.52]KIW94105.1 fumarylacetoacetase [Cladophialophora bantiana CBS 173.52]